MSYEIDSGLKLICNELKRRSQSSLFKERFELLELLKTLNASERHLVAKYFCKLSWNIGSLLVLSILHELRILTATEFVLSCESNDEIQLILNDFLESEYELISNLLINATFDSTYSVRLNSLLEECLENLFKDILMKPHLNDLRFLSYIKTKVPDAILVNIINKLLLSVLKLHESDIKEAFRNFSSWINEGVDDLTFPKDLYKNLISDHIEESLNYLLKLSSFENFKGWKFFCIMLQTICSNNNSISGPFVRKYLNSRIKQCAIIPCKQSMLHMLLTARAATAITMEITTNLNNYARWYKSNIGEMKFSLKVEEFQNILALLEQCVNDEMEIYYLEIHITISILPPILCGKLVQAYKSKCKQRLQQIKKGQIQCENINEDTTECILIDDSN